MAEEKRPDEIPEDETLTLNIVHHIREGLDLTFSDSVAVQHTPTEFTITFAQIQQPLVGKSSDYDAIESIKAEVVARIVLTPAKMVELIKALQENWSIYQRRMKALVEARSSVDTTETRQDPPGKN